MKYTITLDGAASTHMLNYAKKLHLDTAGADTDSAIADAIEHMVYAHARGDVRDVYVTATRVKPKARWTGMLPEKCFQRGWLPDPGYKAKPLGKKQHVLCLESQFPGCVIRKKDFSPETEGLGSGHMLNPAIGAFQRASTEEWEMVTIGLSGQKRHHGMTKRKATVGDLIVTLKLLYRCHDLPVPTQFA